MGINKLYFIVGLVIALALFLELTAHADTIGESTKITVSAPVQIPAQTTPAGSYLSRFRGSR